MRRHSSEVQTILACYLIVLGGSGVEGPSQEELGYHTAQGPHVYGLAERQAQDDLWCPVWREHAVLLEIRHACRRPTNESGASRAGQRRKSSSVGVSCTASKVNRILIGQFTHADDCVRICTQTYFSTTKKENQSMDLLIVKV